HEAVSITKIGGMKSKWAGHKARPEIRCWLCSALALAGGIFYPEVVHNLPEAQTGAIGPHSGHVLLHLVVDHALERHMSVIHDDVDRRGSLDRVARQHRIAVDGPRNL